MPRIGLAVAAVLGFFFGAAPEALMAA